MNRNHERHDDPGLGETLARSENTVLATFRKRKGQTPGEEWRDEGHGCGDRPAHWRRQGNASRCFNDNGIHRSRGNDQGAAAPARLTQ